MRVIIECESCHTRFRLDDARIPATGAKVRCSRCKTAFLVKRPGATPDQVVEEVFAEATGSGGSSAPSATEDLFDTSGRGAGGGLGGSSLTDGGEASSDEAWEFDEAPPANANATAAAPKRAAAPAPAAAEPAESADPEDSFDTLGSPEGWDLVGGSAQKLAAEARFEETAVDSPPPSARVRPPRSVAPLPPSRPERSVEYALAAAALESPSESTAAPLPGWLAAARNVGQLGIDGGVWIASVALCSIGLALAFSPRADSGVSPANTLPAVFGDQQLEVTVHRVESGVGGTLAVVRGQLPESLATREPVRLRASWLDAQGVPLAGASAIVGPPAPREALREQSAGRLQSAAEARALELAASGPFEAVFAELPIAAKGISITRERVPMPAPVATQTVEAAAEAATASSRPTARPSSE
jgi:predicted Zn finger-like uncharacterized protein